MYKIRAIWIMATFLFFAILDATALNYIEIFNVKPDVFLICVLFFALYGGLRTGILSGFAGGLIKDLFTGGMFGVNILFLTLAGAFFGYNFSKFYRERPFVQSALTFFASLVYLFFYYGVTNVIKGAKNIPLTDTGVWSLLVTVGIPVSLYTAALAPFLFFILRRVPHSKY